MEVSTDPGYIWLSTLTQYSTIQAIRIYLDRDVDDETLSRRIRHTSSQGSHFMLLTMNPWIYTYIENP